MTTTAQAAHETEHETAHETAHQTAPLRLSLLELLVLTTSSSLVPSPSSLECNGLRLEGEEQIFMVLDLIGGDRGRGVVPALESTNVILRSRHSENLL